MDFLTIHAAVRDDYIGVITLNRPEKRNALSIKMRQEISACLHRWLSDDRVGLVVITGAGQAFCAGFDLEEFRQQELFYQILESSTRYHLDLWGFPKPTIAAVNGPAVGGGLDLAALCDIRICADTAFFGHPEVKFGAPPLFTPLRWIIGDGLARDLCLTGRRIDAREAHRIGLVSAVEEQGLLAERALQLGATILEAPGDTLHFAKRFFTDNAGKGFEESFRREHDRAFREVLFKKMTPG
ncbi:MAG TPA: enoyl-CoA hydratase/isomerase family protein [Geobacteraceae bacterium]